MFEIGLHTAQGWPLSHRDAPNLTIHILERPHAEWLQDVLNAHIRSAAETARPWQVGPTQALSERWHALDPAIGQRVEVTRGHS